jgi:EpsI family protein
MNTTRLAIAVALVSLTAALAHASYSGTSGQWLGARMLPTAIGMWDGADAPADDPETLELLGADGVVNRVYAAAGGAPVELYVAYYERQRPGVSIHSPLHCLPGTGWEVVSSSTIPYAGAAANGGPAGSIRRLIAQRGATRAVVLYWYSVHGRMVASELASRAYLLGDRIRVSRNDAALVRVVVLSDGNDLAAEQRGLAFIADALSYLPRLWS